MLFVNLRSVLFAEIYGVKTQIVIILHKLLVLEIAAFFNIFVKALLRIFEEVGVAPAEN